MSNDGWFNIFPLFSEPIKTCIINESHVITSETVNMFADTVWLYQGAVVWQREHDHSVLCFFFFLVFSYGSQTNFKDVYCQLLYQSVQMLCLLNQWKQLDFLLLVIIPVSADSQEHTFPIFKLIICLVHPYYQFFKHAKIFTVGLYRKSQWLPQGIVQHRTTLVLLLSLREDEWLCAALDCLDFLPDQPVVELSRELSHCCQQDQDSCEQLPAGGRSQDGGKCLDEYQNRGLCPEEQGMYLVSCKGWCHT